MDIISLLIQIPDL